MTQSITTKYLAPTNQKGGRIKATTTSGISITISWNHAQSIDENHESAMRELCKDLNWSGLFISANTRDGILWINIDNIVPIRVNHIESNSHSGLIKR